MNIEENDSAESLIAIITESGFTVVSVQAVIDALAAMEQYICDEIGIEHSELEPYIEKVQEIVGKEESLSMDLDEIVSWVRAVRGH